MTIAFDIDGTWTLDPKNFAKIALHFKNEGWRVIIATGRVEKIRDVDMERFLISSDIKIYYCGRSLKKKYVEQFEPVDVWVDDEPGTIEECKILKDCEDNEL